MVKVDLVQQDQKQYDRQHEQTMRTSIIACRGILFLSIATLAVGSGLLVLFQILG